MPVPNVANGDVITEAWGDAVADAVNALEAAQPGLATDAELAAHAAAADPHPVYATDANLAAHAAAGHAAGLVHTVNFVIDGGGAVIATGIKGDLIIDFACTITGWALLGDQSGSIVVDVWRDSYANFPPVAGDAITASAKPTIAGATKAKSSTLTGWAPAIAAGDVLRFNVNSVTSMQRVTLALTVART